MVCVSTPPGMSVGVPRAAPGIVTGSLRPVGARRPQSAAFASDAGADILLSESEAVLSICFQG